MAPKSKKTPTTTSTPTELIENTAKAAANDEVDSLAPDTATDADASTTTPPAFKKNPVPRRRVSENSFLMGVRQRLKNILEKPYFILFVCVAAYLIAAIVQQLQFGFSTTAEEDRVLAILQTFGDGEFPPTLELIRSLQDVSGLFYYAVLGKLGALVKWQLPVLKYTHVFITGVFLYLVTAVGFEVISKNRINPLWISLGVLFLALNPALVMHGGAVDCHVFFAALVLASYLFYRKQWFFLMACALSAAVLTDWRAPILAVAISVERVLTEESKVLRIERILLFVMPYAFAAALLWQWRGLIPPGGQEYLTMTYSSDRPLFQLNQLWYVLAAIPVYTVVFSWVMALRGRVRSTWTSAIVAIVAIPIYFFVTSDTSVDAVSETQFMQVFASLVAGEYSAFVLFVPCIFGLFLVLQSVWLPILEETYAIRIFVLGNILTAPFWLHVNEVLILPLLAFTILFALSEALVGDSN